MRVAALYDVHCNVHALDEAYAIRGNCGHTHVQFERKRLVNPGSVGWTWDDERGAYWAILDDGVELRRTPYDVEAAAAAIRATDFLFPSFADDLLAPRGAEATMRRFEEARRG